MSKFTPYIDPPKPQPFSNISLYHTCDHCNKEYEAGLYIYHSNLQAVAMSVRCKHCNNNNIIGIKLVYTP